MIIIAATTLLIWFAWGAAWLSLALAGRARQRRTSASPVASQLGHVYRPLNIIAGTLIVLSLDIQIIAPRHVDESNELLPLIGVVAVAAGLGFCLVCRLQLGKYWTGLVGSTSTHQLVDGGIYNVVRHPIYLGIMIALAGTLAVAQSALAYAGLLVAYLSIIYKIHLEERHLIAALGGSYLAYAHRVPALLPIRF